MMPNQALQGWRRFPLHLFAFGIPFGLLVWFGGWSGAVVLLAWRSYEEFLDWKNHLDTRGKALIDLFSQTVLPVTVAIWKQVR